MEKGEPVLSDPQGPFGYLEGKVLSTVGTDVRTPRNIPPAGSEPKGTVLP